ncbi:uncharacterized protein LOC141607339 [Silene latifolia]|uniref:uncharacterized protein LOC141607339 n=1 Tax=Silene latifolia TaxID=37657 RepID=UPI003D772BCA
MDEKWFFVTDDNEKAYVVEGEELPYRSCQSKRYITKVMFMCAVSMPIYSADGECLFDGKIGMFPFTNQVPAARASRNRPRGTLETKPIESITKVVIKECLIQQVIPAIKRVWPEELYSHYKKKHAIKTVDDLVNEVMQAFIDYSPSKLNNIFLSLQAVMVEIMKCKGHNNFSLPHMGKGHLVAIGMLPRNLEVNVELVRECIDYLQGIGKTEGLEYLMNELSYNVEGIVDQLNGM